MLGAASRQPVDSRPADLRWTARRPPRVALPGPLATTGDQVGNLVGCEDVGIETDIGKPRPSLADTGKGPTAPKLAISNNTRAAATLAKSL